MATGLEKALVRTAAFPAAAWRTQEEGCARQVVKLQRLTVMEAEE